ncbi:putative pseudouridylate synthase [Pseudomonas saudimassiliensis]|uniref:Pseudouridine synthase n=1 Tax=Pseudomonas saudimassiliensis TaxID=1461581 RepID=A0A078MKL8_9PSED|nr:pseudouridine synthase [Pseudomonas saudimassiliensis]CEA06804.1 putative pseudouridylate synthase [Pseudomonas saudimassiliensis]CEF28097.1 putative pseudouridylate synthase [Pseudomonas saudimassiliensis]
MRLDRFIAKHTEHSQQTARRLIACGRVRVDAQVMRDGRQEIDRFATVQLDEQLLQQREALFFMLHKPAGYLSATCDPVHPTVLEFFAPALRPQLHIAGRLDRSTTGLLILTNDGLWSRHLTEPGQRIPKVYLVGTAEPVAEQAAQRFAQGVHLAREAVDTSPAQLQQLGPCLARLTIHEGRHHQVKRMFHAVGNRVTSLHRERMGRIELDPRLPPGQYRPLTAAEIASVTSPASRLV